MNSEFMPFKRLLKMDLPLRQSAFLWGARKTGKTFYLAEHFPQAIRYDFLKTNLFTRYFKEPWLFREEVLTLNDPQLIIIDEVQKIPAVLDEVHWLIENTPHQFILCASSARKLKRGGANLLAGRAWRYEFFPLVYPEIPDFDLLKALQNGLIPSHYRLKSAWRALDSYVSEYLKEEIHAEGLTRNLPAFSRFLDAVAYSHGELINYSNIAQDCGVDAKTVKEYYHILMDTMLGYFVEPYRKRVGREIIASTAKFYLFDVGVAGRLCKRQLLELRGDETGKALEHYILMELMAYRSLKEKEFEIRFWRSNKGLEVDFILGEADVALEVKINDQVRPDKIKGLRVFKEEYQPRRAIVVSLDPRPRLLTEGIEILPYQDFLKSLWAGGII